ncbi:hypothetical protein LIER_02995 [Lithospermum erythrorhizon]|uniref:Reverse transcriptase domain-containing protein n=1 Tax=Lithospermum erythrorhizon TaxID=34254 RepID=A0AAV3NRJ2_LITER
MGTTYPSGAIDLGVLRAGPLVGMDSQTILVAPISNEEIRWVVFDIGDERAPGLDGFTVAFFKANLDIVRGDVVRAVREFYSTGRLLRQLNHTIIALIPKTDRDPGVGDFRPIACANVVYKIITKILAKRMETLLPSLIDRSQGAFVRGRSLVDYVFLPQEIVRGYSVTRTSARYMLMVDLRKAYDTVSWEFLGDVLRGLDFPEGEYLLCGHFDGLFISFGELFRSCASALWSLHSDTESLWVHGNYLKGVSISDYVKRRKDSLLMRSLCDLRDTLVAAYVGRAEAIEVFESMSSVPSPDIVVLCYLEDCLLALGLSGWFGPFSPTR